MKRSLRTLLAIVALLAAPFLFSPKAMADLLDHYGGSPRAISLGGAYTAVAEDYSAVFYNPAGLGQQRLSALSLGYVYFKPNIDYRGGGPSSLTTDISAHSAIIGTVIDIDRLFKGLENHQISAGILAGYLHDMKSVAYVSTSGLRTLQAPLYDSAADSMVVNLGIGGELIHDFLYVGAGFRFGAIYGIPKMQLTTDLVGNYRIRQLDIDADTEISPIGGVIVKPTRNLRLGFSYRGDMLTVGLGGQMQVTAEAIPGVSVPLNLNLLFWDPYNPETYTWGTSYQLTKDLLVALDVSLERWSKFDAPFGYNYPSVFDDVVVPRVGIEWVALRNRPLPFELGELTKLALRTGYFYRESPIAQKQVYTNFIDNNIHGFAWGLGTTITSPKYLWHPMDFDLYVQYLRADARSFRTTEGEVSTEGYHIGAGFMITLKF